MLLICFDVIVRKFFGFTTGGADELSGYAFAISTSWSLAFVVLHRGNVRVDALYQHLPVRLSAILDWLSLVALGVFMAFLTYYASFVVDMSWAQNSAANTPLATPLWIPQGVITSYSIHYTKLYEYSPLRSASAFCRPLLLCLRKRAVRGRGQFAR